MERILAMCGVKALRLAACLGVCWVALPGEAQVSAPRLDGQEAVAVAVPGNDVAEGDGQGGIVARAARLTYLADGVVTVKRDDETDGSAAVLNMALAQGSRVTTSEKAQAEIEFEDGSLVRLTPNSSVRLDFLGSDSQANVTMVRLVSGLVYCELRASKMARFSVMAGGETLWPLENTTLRVSMDDPPVVYSVLAGKMMVEHVARGMIPGEGAAQSIEGYRTEVKAGESLRSDATNASRYFLASSIPPESWDNWNEGRDQTALNALASETPVRNTFAGSQRYGWSDLDAGGTWYDQGEQGPVWQPAEALAVGFDPYGYGSWSYFPGGGYTWASGYAWGWTPFRCGRWQYWDQFGWGWQPDAFCRTDWRYGVERGNVSGGPRGYVPVRVPVRRPIGVHPILPGPHPGERPPLARGPVERREREIAGVTVRPIGVSGHGVTSRGGSAIGGALRRDYAVDQTTRLPVNGVAQDPNRIVVTTPVSAGAGWRAVSARPEPPASSGGGGLRGLFGHSSHTAEVVPVRVDGRGNPYVGPVQRPSGDGDRSRSSGQPVGLTNAHTQPVQGAIHSEAVLGNSHTQAVQNNVHSQPAPQQSFHAQPSYQAAPHAEIHSSPPPSAPAAAAPAAAASSKK